MKKFFRVLFVLTIFLSFSLQAQDVEKLRAGYKGPKAKYIFYFIGDGMGLAHISGTEAYRAAVKGMIGLDKLNFTKFPHLALAATYAKDRYITDSAAAGTALATGNKTSVDTVGMDATRTKKFTSMAELAKKNGMKVGIISTVNINDATPACFYAHQPNREMAKEISEELLKSGFDYFAGGGLKGIKDMKDFLNKGGYKFIDSRKEFNSFKDKNVKVYAECPIVEKSYACRHSMDQGPTEIPLNELTKKGIELLDNPNGFFMMIEGGKIDWAAHGNDTAGVVYDVIALDNAVGEALKFYDKHPDETIIVVTADHETGGFSLGHRAMFYESALKKIGYQKISLIEFDKKIAEYRNAHTPENAKLEDMLPVVKKYFGLGSRSKGLELSEKEMAELKDAFFASMTGKRDKDKYGKEGEPFSAAVVKLLSNKAGLSWTTNSHTGMPTVAFAKGDGAELFSGYIENTDVAKNIMTVAGLK
jgi:alkaline phosphatase